jgi:hypothetical protein
VRLEIFERDLPRESSSFSEEVGKFGVLLYVESRVFVLDSDNEVIMELSLPPREEDEVGRSPNSFELFCRERIGRRVSVSAVDGLEENRDEKEDGGGDVIGDCALSGVGLTAGEVGRRVCELEAEEELELLIVRLFVQFIGMPNPCPPPLESDEAGMPDEDEGLDGSLIPFQPCFFFSGAVVVIVGG